MWIFLPGNWRLDVFASNLSKLNIVNEFVGLYRGLQALTAKNLTVYQGYVPVETPNRRLRRLEMEELMKNLACYPCQNVILIL